MNILDTKSPVALIEYDDGNNSARGSSSYRNFFFFSGLAAQHGTGGAGYKIYEVKIRKSLE